MIRMTRAWNVASHKNLDLLLKIYTIHWPSIAIFSGLSVRGSRPDHYQPEPIMYVRRWPMRLSVFVLQDRSRVKFGQAPTGYRLKGFGILTIAYQVSDLPKRRFVDWNKFLKKYLAEHALNGAKNGKKQRGAKIRVVKILPLDSQKHMFYSISRQADIISA